MLSSENPPPDVLCSCKISPLSNGDEEASDDNSLPSFSIRGYVFGTRGKDIRNNWPFSDESLQLCLKYGVKDVLPPFDQTLDSVRNPSTAKCGAENLSIRRKTSLIIENITNSNGSQKASQSFTDTNSFPKKARKCRLVVKRNKDVPKISSHDLTVDPALVSETMASKVCPVCKTFSSSSNTTLNAHIDQCLSVGPTIKWTSDTKQAMKHRIKPMKMKLISDIYETALSCSLEDLDRRNGTNWGSNGPCSSAIVGDVDGDAGVYVNSNGTKVRILSKLGDLPLSTNAGYNCGPSKPVKTDKGKNCGSGNKKMFLVQKQKLLDHCLNGGGFYPPGPDCLAKFRGYGQKSSDPRPEVWSEPKVKNGQHKRPEGCKILRQPQMALDQMKSKDMGIMTKQWVGSKGTGLREVNPKYESQHSRKLKKNSRTKNGVSSDENNPLIPKTQSRHDRTKNSVRMVWNKNNHVSFSNGKEKGVDGYPAVNGNSSFLNSRMSQHHTFSPGGNGLSYLRRKSFTRSMLSRSKKNSSLRKKLLPVRHTSVMESRKKMLQKHLDFNKHGLHCESESEDEAVLSRIPIYKQSNSFEPNEGLTGKACNKPLMNTTRVSRNQKKEGFVNADNGGISLKAYETSPESMSHDVVKNIDPSEDSYNVNIPDEFVREPSCEMADQHSFAALSNSMGPTFHGPGGPKIECVSMFRADEIGRDLVISPHSCYDGVAEIYPGVTQRNYYVDVDPIPIPGPPGSFLPSPGRSSSEGLNEISSLTTCRIQSSDQGEHDAVDIGSSRPSVSPISTVSNSLGSISGSPCCQQKLDEEKLNAPEFEKSNMNSSIGFDPGLGFKNSVEGLFSTGGEYVYCEPTMPSSSNPVLRLMGKNLTVVNKDENGLSMAVERPGPWFCVDNGLCTGHVYNRLHSFGRTFSGGPPILESMQIGMPLKGLHHVLSDLNFEKVANNFLQPQFSARPCDGFGGNTSSSMRYQDYAGGCALESKQIGSNWKVNPYPNFEKVGTPISHVEFSSSKLKEIIMNDGSPEMGDESFKAVKATHGMANPLYGYPLCAGSPSIQNGSNQEPYSKGMNERFGDWINCTAEGSNALHPNSSTASLPCTADRLKFSFCLSHSFS